MSQIQIDVDLDYDVTKIISLTMATNLTAMSEGPPKHWTATRNTGEFFLTCACACNASTTIKCTVTVPNGFRFEPPPADDPRTRKFRFTTATPTEGIGEDFFSRPIQIVEVA